jgi:hypothetical protein
LSTEAHTTHSRRFNDKPLPGHGAKRAAAFSVHRSLVELPLRTVRPSRGR